MARAGGEQVENVRYPNAQAANAGATPAMLRVGGDSVQFAHSDTRGVEILQPVEESQFTPGAVFCEIGDRPRASGR